MNIPGFVAEVVLPASACSDGVANCKDAWGDDLNCLKACRKQCGRVCDSGGGNKSENEGGNGTGSLECKAGCWAWYLVCEADCNLALPGLCGLVGKLFGTDPCAYVRDQCIN